MVASDIGIDMPKLAEAPVATVDLSKVLLDVAVDGDPIKADFRDLFQSTKIVTTVGPNRHFRWIPE
jgi:hypothetical protein